MKSFLNIFFAVVLILVSAEVVYAADLTVNGEYRIRGFDYSSVSGFDTGAGDSADYLDQRFLLTGTVTQGMTKGVVELSLVQTNNGYGLVNSGSSEGGNIMGNGYSNNLALGGIHQAFINVTFPAANLVAGRSIIKLGHGIILNDTVDNLTLKIPYDTMTLDLGYLKIAEPDSINNCSPGLPGCATQSNGLDNTGYLINFGWKPVDTWKLGAFYVSDSQALAAASNTTENVGGLSLDAQSGPVYLSFEYDNISGKAGPSSNIKGQNIFLVISGDVNIARVGAGYLRVTGASAGSGDVSSNSIAGDFAAGHGILLNDQTRYGGGVDLNSRVVDANYGANPVLNNNFHALKLFAETMPMTDLNVGIEIFPLVQLVDSGVAAGTPLAQIAANGDTNIGQEYNIYGGYKLDKNLSLTAVAAYFNTGAVVRDLAQIESGSAAATNKNVTKLTAALTFTF